MNESSDMGNVVSFAVMRRAKQSGQRPSTQRVEGSEHASQKLARAPEGSSWAIPLFMSLTLELYLEATGDHPNTFYELARVNKLATSWAVRPLFVDVTPETLEVLKSIGFGEMVVKMKAKFAEAMKG